jgi:hypothetical protein
MLTFAIRRKQTVFVIFFAIKVIGDLCPQFGHCAAVCVSLQQLHVQESQGRSNKNDSRLPAHGNKPSDIPRPLSLRRGVFTYSLSLAHKHSSYSAWPQQHFNVFSSLSLRLIARMCTWS